MSHLLTDDDLRTEREPLKEPAKAWRNWWIAVGYFDDEIQSYAPGDVYPGIKLWPSKDVAESAAAKQAVDSDYASGDGLAEYLGALPEGERPA
jgi:hypothetical protein